MEFSLDNMSPFNLVWNALHRAMGHVVDATIVTRVFGAYDSIVSNKPAIADATANLQGFQDFVFLVARKIPVCTHRRNKQHGAEKCSAVLNHPLWRKLRECVENDQLNLQMEIKALRTSMAELEGFKARIRARGPHLLLSECECERGMVGSPSIAMPRHDVFQRRRRPSFGLRPWGDDPAITEADSEPEGAASRTMPALSR